MLSNKSLEYFSWKSNLPVDCVRREIEEKSRFIRETFDTERDRETDPGVVRRIMSECVRRSEAAVLPYVKNYYLFFSAVIAAMYIFAHEDDWMNGTLPEFYDDALSHAQTAWKAEGKFSQLVVFNMLKLYNLKDVQEIVDNIKEVRRYVHDAKKYSNYFISEYRHEELYIRYGFTCYRAMMRICWDESVSLDEKIRLCRHLLKFKDGNTLLRVCYQLYILYFKKFKLNRESDSNFNLKIGKFYFLEYLEKAYTVMGYKLENLNLRLYSQRTWLRVAVEYSYFMMHFKNDRILPYNPAEAEKIFRFAAQTDIEDISAYGKSGLEEFFEN